MPFSGSACTSYHKSKLLEPLSLWHHLQAGDVDMEHENNRQVPCRFMLGSMVSPHTGALTVPAAQPGSFGGRLGANDTPCSEWSSGASTASIASHLRTCARAGDIDMRDTPACRTAPGQQFIAAPLDTAGRPRSQKFLPEMA